MYNFCWQPTTEIVITDRNCNKLFFILISIAKFERKWYLSTQILIIDKQYFTTFIIFENINQLHCRKICKRSVEQIWREKNNNIWR